MPALKLTENEGTFLKKSSQIADTVIWGILSMAELSLLERVNLWLDAWLKSGPWRIARDLCSLVILSLMSALLIMLLAGDRFSQSLSYLGLYHEKGGVYSECRSARDKDNPYCAPVTSSYDREWKRVSSGMPFSLSGR
jgi:hypothetical protein